MENNAIVKSTPAQNKLGKLLLLLCIILLSLGIVLSIITYLTGQEYNRGYSFHNPFLNGGKGGTSYVEDSYDNYRDEYSFFEFYEHTFFDFDVAYWIIILAAVAVFFIYLFNHFQMDASELTIFANRLTGTSSFGKHIDLPLTQITTISLGRFSSIVISTASGNLKFWLIENRDEMYSAISNMISKAEDALIVNTQGKEDIVNELKEYKALLEDGIISQEEFDAKKKQLLDL